MAPRLLVIVDDYISAELALHVNIPVHGIRVNSIEESPLRTVEGMAMQATQRIRAVQSAGPYYIIGNSFGAVIAYEVATQLTAEDQEVAFIGLIDAECHSPSTEHNYRTSDDCLQDVNRASSLNLESQGEICFDASPNTNADSDELANIQTETRRGRIGHHRVTGRCNRTSARLGGFRMLCDKYSSLVAQYSAQALSIPVHVFLTHKDQHTFGRLGWTIPSPDKHVHIVSGLDEGTFTERCLDIKCLAQIIADTVRHTNASRSSSSALIHDPLVMLQSGKRGRAPLVCGPGGGASTVCFADLVSCLDTSLPICGLEPRGLDGVLIPHSSVLAASRRYIEAIEGVYPKGNIHLFGHSFGGWIVFEIAQQMLKGGNHAIGAVMILDSEAPCCDLSIREYNRTDVLMKYIEAIELSIERPLGIERADIESIDECAQRKYIHQRLLHDGLLSRRTDPNYLRGPLHAFAMALRANYCPETPYSGQVQLILVDDPRLDVRANQQRQEKRVAAWTKWAPNLNHYHVSGNHMTILRKPHADSIATLIERAMESADRRPYKAFDK